MTLEDSMSDWHCVRPWLPPLGLSVLEITSVSVTFLLTATMVPLVDPELQAQLAETECIVTEALANGLSVKVNGSAWQRVIIRIDEAADEAVVIIYGLMPGRQYDIELAMVRAGQLRREITTDDGEPSPGPDLDCYADSVPTPVAPPPTAPDHSPAAPSPFTIEDRLSQLTSSLSLLSSQRDSLQSQIKSVRRDGQKADAALRSEIEALKRTSEKNIAAENRAKQKILALQEAVKRTHVGTRAMEQELDQLKCSLPALREEKERKERDYEFAKKEADRVTKQRQMVDDQDKKRVDKLRSEHSSLTHKLEKMMAKREKMQGSVLLDLEEQLAELRREWEMMESEQDQMDELVAPSEIEQQNYSLSATTRRRANTAASSLSLSGLGPISRPSRDTTNAAPSPTLTRVQQQTPSTQFRTESSASSGLYPSGGLVSAQLGHSFDGTSSHLQSTSTSTSISSQQHVKSYSQPPLASYSYAIPSLLPSLTTSQNNIQPPSSPTTASSSSSSSVRLHSPPGLSKMGVIGSSLGGRAIVGGGDGCGGGGGGGGEGSEGSASAHGWISQRSRPYLQQ